MGYEQMQNNRAYVAGEVTAPPVCLIYDEQMRLSARHKGVISVDQIIDLMDNGQKNHK